MKKVVSKYTSAHEQRLIDSQPINKAVSEALAAEFGGKDAGFTPASIRAKAVRMGLTYERQQPQTKNGAPVERKESIVEELAAIVGQSLEGLEKAPKPVLQALRNHLAG